MSTPTPETDAEVRHWNCARIDFARRLERERDAARADAAMSNKVALQMTARLHAVAEERDEARAEARALSRWKAEALSVAPPLQEIGVALGLPLGASIHDKILPALQALQVERDGYKALVEAYRDLLCFQRVAGLR